MSKITDIAEAWMKDEPVDEKWYQERLSICKTCPMNSANVEKKDKTFIQKTREAIGGIFAEDYCTACGCTIRKKASLKQSICGAVEATPPLPPKWGALEVSTMTHNKSVIVSHVEGQNYSLVFGNPMEIHLGEREEDMVEFTVDVKYDEKLRFDKITVSCGCTATNITPLKDNNFRVTVKISTIAFTVDKLTKKSYFLNFLDQKTNFEQIHQVQCLIEKKTPTTRT